MNELIKITEKDGKQVVSARELHEFLENRDNVNTWFQRQAERAMLEDGQDFVSVAILQPSGQTSKDYAVSLNSAKEIAMLNGGEKGKQARKYFIECEKIAKDLQEINHKPMNELEMISFMALKLNNQKIEQERQSAMITVLTAKVDAMQQDYFSVQGYANLHKIKIDHATCNKLGRRASKISREDCAKIGKAKHQIYGEVNTYHEDILKDIFDEWLTN
jgi:phage anti-repressor protein